MELVGKILLGVAVNYGVHYTSMAAHNWVCMPHGFGDILKGLVVTASPVCSTLLTIGQTTQSGYATLVTSAVTMAVVNSINMVTQTPK
jgi:predicted RND superfamily exporter protein